MSSLVVSVVKKLSGEYQYSRTSQEGLLDHENAESRDSSPDLELADVSPEPHFQPPIFTGYTPPSYVRTIIAPQPQPIVDGSRSQQQHIFISDADSTLKIVPSVDDVSPDVECGELLKSAATSPIAKSATLLAAQIYPKPLYTRLVKCCNVVGAIPCCPLSLTGGSCFGTSLFCHYLSRSICVLIVTFLAFCGFVLFSEAILYPLSSCAFSSTASAPEYQALIPLLPTPETDLLQLSNASPDLLHLRPNHTLPLRLHHLRQLGTHNSYHLASSFRPKIGAHQYTHPGLSHQLNVGVRQIEIDIHPTKDGFLVFHLALLDDKSTCKCLADCLAIIAEWSKSNPTHAPLTILFEMKIMPYEDLRASFSGASCEILDKIEAQVSALFNTSKIIYPSEVRGSAGSVKDALTAQMAREKAGIDGEGGWPTLESSRGKLIFGWLDDVHKWGAKMQCASADNRMLFLVQASASNPWSSILSLPDPDTMTGAIVDAVQQGMIVRTITDTAKTATPNPARYEIALQTSAQMLSTDFVGCEPNNPQGESQKYFGSTHGPDGRYCERLPTGLPLECAYLTAPANCQAQLMAAYGSGML